MPAHKIGVVRVDVGQLYGDEVLHHLVGHGQPLPEEFRGHLADPLAQGREALELGDVRQAVLDDELHLLIDQLHALEARVAEEADLLLDEQLEGHLGDEQARLGAHGVADGVVDVGRA